MDLSGIMRIVDDSAIDFCEHAGIQHEDAKKYILEYLGADIPDGYLSLWIEGDEVTSIGTLNFIDNICKLSFSDFLEMLYESAEIGAASVHKNYVFIVLGGLFLLRKVRHLTRIRLEPLDALMIISLLENHSKLRLSLEEWRARYHACDLMPKGESTDFQLDRDEFLRHARKLKRLRAVECDSGIWSISTSLVFDS